MSRVTREEGIKTDMITIVTIDREEKDSTIISGKRKGFKIIVVASTGDSMEEKVIRATIPGVMGVMQFWEISWGNCWGGSVRIREAKHRDNRVTTTRETAINKGKATGRTMETATRETVETVTKEAGMGTGETAVLRGKGNRDNVDSRETGKTETVDINVDTATTTTDNGRTPQQRRDSETLSTPV